MHMEGTVKYIWLVPTVTGHVRVELRLTKIFLVSYEAAFSLLGDTYTCSP